MKFFIAFFLMCTIIILTNAGPLSRDIAKDDRVKLPSNEKMIKRSVSSTTEENTPTTDGSVSSKILNDADLETAASALVFRPLFRSREREIETRRTKRSTDDQSATTTKTKGSTTENPTPIQNYFTRRTGVDTTINRQDNKRFARSVDGILVPVSDEDFVFPFFTQRKRRSIDSSTETSSKTTNESNDGSIKYQEDGAAPQKANEEFTQTSSEESTSTPSGQGSAKFYYFPQHEISIHDYKRLVRSNSPAKIAEVDDFVFPLCNSRLARSTPKEELSSTSSTESPSSPAVSTIRQEILAKCKDGPLAGNGANKRLTRSDSSEVIHGQDDFVFPLCNSRLARAVTKIEETTPAALGITTGQTSTANQELKAQIRRECATSPSNLKAGNDELSGKRLARSEDFVFPLCSCRTSRSLHQKGFVNKNEGSSGADLVSPLDRKRLTRAISDDDFVFPVNKRLARSTNEEDLALTLKEQPQNGLVSEDDFVFPSRQ